MAVIRTKYLILLLLFFVQYSAIAQIDSTFIGSFEQNFSAKIYGGYDFTLLTHRYLSQPTETYMPHVPPYIGFGATWKGIGGSFSSGFEFINPDKKRERSKYLDLQFHFYGKKFVFDFFGQTYKGLSIKEDANQHFCSDIKLMEFGGLVQYNFNYKHFSYRAAFDQTEMQLKSSGTPLVNLAFYYTKVNADILFTEEKVNSKQHYLFGAGAGYAYTWVFKKNYFASGSFSLGLNASIDDLNKKLGFCPTFFPRVATGYNAKEWSIGLSAQYNLIYMSFTKTDKLGMGTLNGQVTFIKRFNFNSKLLDKMTFQKYITRKD